MNIFAIETSTDWCSIAFIQNEKCLSKIEKQIPRKHAEKLPEFYKSLNQKMSLDKINLDAVAISIGPGSFTGLRVGLGFAKGLAFAKGLPIVPVPTLQTIATGCDIISDEFIVLLYSHGEVVFHQKFSQTKDRLRALTQEKADIWSALNLSGKIVQYGCEALMNDEPFISSPPSAEMTGILAEKYFDDWVVHTPFELVPNYISAFTLGAKK